MPRPAVQLQLQQLCLFLALAYLQNLPLINAAKPLQTPFWYVGGSQVLSRCPPIHGCRTLQQDKDWHPCIGWMLPKTCDHHS